MGIIVSSRLDFILKNPNNQVSYAEVEHELQHLKRREQVSNVVAVAGLALAMINLAGIISGGAFILGALLAIAVFAAAYSYCCRLAESSLREKQATWVVGPPKINVFPKREVEGS